MYYFLGFVLTVSFLKPIVLAWQYIGNMRLILVMFSVLHFVVLLILLALPIVELLIGTVQHVEAMKPL